MAIFRFKWISKNRVTAEPIKAAGIEPPIAIKLEGKNIKNKATPKEAPEEIPKTKGPAKGFLNHACNCIPATAKLEPAVIAHKVRGSLNSQNTI